jgi:hypothetical protein
MRIEINLERPSPPAGSMSIDGGRLQPFSSWLELLALLEAATLRMPTGSHPEAEETPP